MSDKGDFVTQNEILIENLKSKMRGSVILIFFIAFVFIVISILILFTTIKQLSFCFIMIAFIFIYMASSKLLKISRDNVVYLEVSCFNASRSGYRRQNFTYDFQVIRCLNSERFQSEELTDASGIFIDDTYTINTSGSVKFKKQFKYIVCFELKPDNTPYYTPVGQLGVIEA